MKMRKTVACFMAAIMLFGMTLCGCSKEKKREVTIVLEEDTWYDTKRVELESGINKSDYRSVSISRPIRSEDNFICTTEIDLKPGTYDTEKDDSRMAMVSVFDKDGKKIKDIDLMELFVGDKKTTLMEPIVTPGKDGCINLYFRLIPWQLPCPDENLEGTFYVTLDAKDGTVKGDVKRISDDLGSLDQIYSIGGYDVITSISMIDESSMGSGLWIMKDGELISTPSLYKDLGQKNCMIMSLLGEAENGDLEIAVCFEGGEAVVDIDLMTGKATMTDKEMPTHRYRLFGGRSYEFDTECIRVYDDGNEEEILNFNECNVNREEASSGDLLSINDDEIVFTFQKNYDDDPVVYILDRADKNPNAGKKKIKAGSADVGDYLDYIYSEAIRKFNNENSEYFVEYVAYKIGDADIDTSPEGLQKEISDTVISEIESGNGPDILFGTSDNVELLNGRYLEDMSSFADSLSESDYYTNIISASKIDGHQYYIPLAFDIEGIVCDREQKGFTFDEYKDFVSTDCNGTEPCTEAWSKMEFFNMCFMSSYDEFYKEGKLSLDNDSFRSMAQYFKDNVPEGVMEEEIEPGIVVMGYSSMTHGPEYVSFGSLRSFAHQCGYYAENAHILGLPSSDGKGAGANIRVSVSILKDSLLKDGCNEFLGYCLDEEVQKATELFGYIYVNKDSEKKFLALQDEKNKDDFWEFENSFPYVGGDYNDVMRQFFTYKPDTGIPELFYSISESIDNVTYQDNTIIMIVDEEIQAYFAGQKDLDTTVKTIENRAQKAIDERK